MTTQSLPSILQRGKQVVELGRHKKVLETHKRYSVRRTDRRAEIAVQETGNMASVARHTSSNSRVRAHYSQRYWGIFTIAHTREGGARVAEAGMEVEPVVPRRRLGRVGWQ